MEKVKELDPVFEERRLKLQLDQSAKDFIVAVGYDPLFGARPIKRAIQNELENPLAKELLANHFTSGNTIFVTKGEKGLIFSKK